MDPNEALKFLRQATARMLAHETNGTDPDYDEAIEVAERFEALDKWISNGGFLPKEWTR